MHYCIGAGRRFVGRWESGKKLENEAGPRVVRIRNLEDHRRFGVLDYRLFRASYDDLFRNITKTTTMTDLEPLVPSKLARSHSKHLFWSSLTIDNILSFQLRTFELFFETHQL